MMRNRADVAAHSVLRGSQSAFLGRQGQIVLGDKGVLRPGGLRWLRAIGWLILLFAVSVAIMSMQSVIHSILPSPTLTIAMAFVVTALVYTVYILLVSWGEKRPVAELDPRPLIKEYLLGAAAGFGIITATVGSLWLAGYYDIRAGDWSDWPHDLRETIGTGLLEELLARLILFRLLSRAFGSSWGFALSAVAFGAAHLMNAHSSYQAALAIAIEAGLLFAAFFFATGRIWMSAGVHAGWNLTLGGIFGATVSGMPSTGSLLVSTPVSGSPNILTGGAFGPEASLPAVAIGLLCFGAVLQRCAPVASPAQYVGAENDGILQ